MVVIVMDHGEHSVFVATTRMMMMGSFSSMWEQVAFVVVAVAVWIDS